jgi:hypothetical protein
MGRSADGSVHYVRRAAPLFILVGAAALFAGLFLPWFELDLGKVTGLNAVTRQLAEQINKDFELTGWEVYSGLDFVLAAVAVAAVVSLVVPKIPREVVLGLGVAALVVLVLRTLDPPGDGGFVRRGGLFVSLGGALVITVGAVMRRTP